MARVRWVLTVVTALTAAMLAASTGAGPATASAGPAVRAQLSSQDRAWLVKVHRTNLAEIKAGTVAEQQATTGTVRSIGQILVHDHQQADASLTSLASRLDVSLPSSPSPKQQADLASVAAKSGSAFDHAFVQTETAGHQTAIALTQAETAGGSSAAVVKLANATLPVLQKHLALLQQAAAQLPPSQVPTGNGGQATLAAALFHDIAYGLLGLGLVLLACGVGLACRRV